MGGQLRDPFLGMWIPFETTVYLGLDSRKATGRRIIVACVEKMLNSDRDLLPSFSQPAVRLSPCWLAVMTWLQNRGTHLTISMSPLELEFFRPTYFV